MAEDTKNTPKSMSEQRFLDHIYDGYQAGQRYCFVLGAGAAKASGIRTGEEMMREWREYLQGKGMEYIRDSAKELDLKEEEYLHLFENNYNLKNDDYFTLFDLRFAGMPAVAYKYLEDEMEGKYPSSGYFPLAMLLSNTENRLVITTNFDTLLEDAIYTYAFKHPLVVGHESLASYIGNDARHPMIAKIHRDLLFRPFNRKQDMYKLKEEWEQPLRNALSRYIPIVIGYAGGDHTFMSLLEEIQLNGIYWCHLGDTPSEKIRNIVAKHNGYTVKILGFDEIMFRLGERFADEAKFGDPCQYMQEQTEERCRRYRESLERIKKKYERGKSYPEIILGGGGNNATEKSSGSEENGEAVVDLIDAIERHGSRQSPGEEANSEISRLQNEAMKKMLLGEYEEALSLYTKLNKLRPDDAAFYERRSTVLHMMGRYDEAVRDDTKAIELDPNNADYYFDRAATLYEMGQDEQALLDITKAIELNPNNAGYYNNRAVTLHAMGQYEQALPDRTKAIEIDPN
ncbi:MAG: tetratricopeptide repeat protein, partial [Christensenellaceae bacterium]|nr:tetratricopeptide repeat protein [Christensenellaceae bacterium]